MLGRKSKYEKRDYLKQFKIGKATYSESLIYEAYGGLQNDGIMLAVYYDVDAAKIIHQLDSWEKINDSPTISSILKNVSSYFGLDFVIPEIASGNFFLYDNSQHKELRSEAEMNTSTALLKNSIRSSLSAACSAALKNFFKKCRLIRRLHLHPTGRFRTGQNLRPVRLPAAVSGAGWIRTCPHQRCFSRPRPQGICSAGAW